MRGFLYGKVFSVRMTLWKALRGGEERCGKRCGGRCGAGREARFYTEILNPVILRIRDLDEILAEEA